MDISSKVHTNVQYYNCDFTHNTSLTDISSDLHTFLQLRWKRVLT